MFRKAFLIPEQERSYNKELAKILSNTTIPEDRKLKLYMQILRKYLHYAKQESPIPVQPDRSTPIKQDVKEEPVDILDGIPKSYRKRGEAILEKMVKNELTWTPQGNLIHRGDVIPSTNIQKIIKYMVKKNKSPPPDGYHLVSDLVKTPGWTDY